MANVATKGILCIEGNREILSKVQWEDHGYSERLQQVVLAAE